jgi:FkbM family methyltransferase
VSATRSAYGWVLPSSDRHFAAYLAKAPKLEGRRMYQPEHITKSVAMCRRRRVAIDVGAHVGFWSYYLAMRFETVHAFEPSELFASCFTRNVRAKNVILHRIAVGENTGTVEMEMTPENTGATHVRHGSPGSIPMRRLDDFGLENVDFMKVDVEGYERMVIEGARETLLRCKPLVIVEQKDFGSRYGDEPYAAAELLESLGAVIIDRVVQDLVLAWPGAASGA